MTVNTISSIAEFDTNGVTTNFPFYFKFLASEDLVVTYIDPAGASSTLTLGTHYTVNGVGNDQGGSIITTSALVGPGQLVVSREMDAFQLTSLRNQGKFLAETHEDVFDKLTMLIQQGFAIFTRALTRPFGRDYFFAEDRRIASVKDPVDDQDAATKAWAQRYVGEIVGGAQGPINNASNVIYIAPNGIPRVVQDMSSDIGASLLAYKGSDTGSVTQTIQQVLDNRNAYPFQFKLPSDPDDTLSLQRALATGKLVDGLGLNYIISDEVVVPSVRMMIRTKMFKADSANDHMNMIVTGTTDTPSDNIHLMEVELNGNREGQTNIGFGASGDGDRCGFLVFGQATNIRLTRCKGMNCATDGLALFGAAAGVTFAIKGITLDQCDFQWNRRHGVSMDTLKNIRSFGGNWLYNGLDLPGAAGHPITSGWYGARVGSVLGPQYGNGCDIESYGADNSYGTHVEDAEFYGTNMYGNYSGGLKVLTMVGNDYNGSPGYTNPLWKPMKGIKVFGGYFDAGIAPPSGGTSPIQIGAELQLPSDIVGLDGLFVSGARCSSSVAINNAINVEFDADIETVNGGIFKHHAFIQNSKGNFTLRTPQALSVYQDNAQVTINKFMSSSVVPSLTASGGAISSQTTTLVSSSLQSGQLYRINAIATLGLAVGSNLQLNVTGGRTVLDAHGSYFNTATTEVRAAFYRLSGGYFLMRPDTQAPLEIVLYVTVA